MKKLLTISLFLLIISIPCWAQKRYKGFVDVKYGMLFGEKEGSVYHFDTSHGSLIGNIFLGGGIGLDYYYIPNKEYDKDFVLPPDYDGFGIFKHVKVFDGISVPVFMNVKGLWPKKKISPTFDLKGGLSMGFVFGCFAETGIGCRFKLKEKTALSINAFISNAFELEAMVTDDSEYDEGHFTNAGVSISFEF